MLRRALAVLALAILPATAHAQTANWGCGMESPYQTVMAAPVRGLVHMELAANVAPCAPGVTTVTTPAQEAEWGCGGLPPYSMVEASKTRMIMQLEIAVRNQTCLGIAQRVMVGTATKFRVVWFPCPGQAGWRLGGDSTTMAKAVAAAAKPPLCPPIRSNFPTRVPPPTASW